jgi:hypothetical protein
MTNLRSIVNQCLFYSPRHWGELRVLGGENRHPLSFPFLPSLPSFLSLSPPLPPIHFLLPFPSHPSFPTFPPLPFLSPSRREAAPQPARGSEGAL